MTLPTTLPFIDTMAVMITSTTITMTMTMMMTMAITTTMTMEGVALMAMEEAIRRRVADCSISDTTRYVELAIVNDPGLMAEWATVAGGAQAFLQEKTISIVATLQNYYLNTDWGTSVGTIQIVLSAIFYLEDWSELNEPSLSCTGDATEASLYDSSPGSNYCEVQYASYLSNFQSYRQIHLSGYDNAQLFSYYDFASSVIGYASLPGMCIASSSGGIEQCTYDDEYNANIVAHEMGHNFNMQHDSNGNACDNSAFIMAAVGSPYGSRPDSFSECSVDYNEDFFTSASYSTTLQCLDNKPTETSFAVCRNGFVEEGESCDCGETNCASTDPCCDGSTCALYASAECSNSDDCCQDCQFKSAGTICRELDADNGCDIDQEVCDGQSSECPPDFRKIEGTTCDSGDSFGMCYAGECVSIEAQCEQFGVATGISYDIAATSCSGYNPQYEVGANQCNVRISCKKVSDGSCVTLTGEKPDDGVPCDGGQCYDGGCETSSSVETYLWTVYAWQSCSIDCKSSSSDTPGNQTRVVECTKQDGTAVSSSLCDSDSIPVSTRLCNDYVCDFCAIQPDGLTVCGVHGSCESDLGVCVCDSGWDGSFCDTAPGLNFTAIVSQSYFDPSNGSFISERANPCGSIEGSFDLVSNTYTIPESADSLTDLKVGATVGLRWLSAGDIELLAVGMRKVEDVDGDGLEDDVWPFYVGNSLAHDDSTCDYDDNSTNYDPCLEKLECNDFTFTIPTSTVPGQYRIVIRFNNVYNIETEPLAVECSESNCNSAGHGQCNAEGTGCDCDDGWSGDSCADSVCLDWTFSVCQRDEDGNCGSLGQSDVKPHCFNSSCSTLNATDYVVGDECIDDTTASGCSNEHFEGSYCEVPRDFCGAQSTESECDQYPVECQWNSTRCLYSQCAQFVTESECEGSNNETTLFASNASWSMFCEWHSDEGYCNRITCGDGALPSCSNGAVRRPIYDRFSQSSSVGNTSGHSGGPTSICRAWYCDCTTVEDYSSSYWKTSETVALVGKIDDNFAFDETLTSSYISDDDLPLFLCTECSLDCQHGSSADAECTNCDEGCPIEAAPGDNPRAGTECDQVFWIADFRLKVDWDRAFVSEWDTFEPLLVSDLAYFLNTDSKHISIWQLKPDGDGSIVYFRYLFDTDSDDETQMIGGDIMVYATTEMADDTSTAVRGFLMEHTDTAYAFTYCIPSKENCDPADDFSIVQLFYYCLGGSFVLITIVVIVYRCATRKKRQKAYEAKVREVRQAQLRLMEHHSKARRVGMRDVSKKRASKIHKAHAAKEKKEQKELKERAKAEKKMHKMHEEEQLPGSQYAAIPEFANSVSGHKRINSKAELEQYRSSIHKSDSAHSGGGGGGPQYAASAGGVGNYRPPRASGRGSGAHSVHSAHSEQPLPKDWRVYFNENGVPYYHNSRTGQTTWRHPAQ